MRRMRIDYGSRKEGMNMCAIAGIISLEARDTTINQMLHTMARRGPDGSGIWQRDVVCLLHSRLAIIDPDGGKQPMELQHNGEEYVLVYNGELYNTDEIRSQLIRAGHRFEGHSDTEVVLHAYAQWQEKCLDRFNGIFAFAVFEKKRNIYA